MSMNLDLRLQGVLLDKLYQTPTSITYWCLYQKRYFKRNPTADKGRHAPFCTPQQSYYKYAQWCWQLAHSWCEGHEAYIQEAQSWGEHTFPVHIVSKGAQNKDTYDSMRQHLQEVRTLLAAGAIFDYH